MRIKTEQAAFELPFLCSEMSFSDFCDFLQCEHEYLEAEDFDDRFEALIRSVECFTHCDLDFLPFSFAGDDKLIRTSFRVRLGVDLSLMRVYAHIINVIEGYRTQAGGEKTFEFKHKGKTFHLNGDRAVRTMMNLSMTTGEVFECLEYQRRNKERREQHPTEVGNLEFSLGLSEFAILVRQPGEKLPSNKSQRRRFIERRREFFADLPLDKVLDVRFFFLRSLLRFGTIQNTSISGRVRHTVRSVKRVNGKKIWKMWRGMPFR
jgi:hypothetical protein